MVNVYTAWETFINFMGSKIWIIFFLISVVYIIIRVEKKSRRTIILLIAAAVLFLYNDVVQKLIAKVSGYETYYRFFWLVPVAIVCAYAVVLMLNHKEIPKILRAVILSGVIVILFFTQSDFYDTSSKKLPENKYWISEDVIAMSYLIGQDKTEEKPTIAASNDIELAYISYDADAVMGIGVGAYTRYYGRYSWGDTAETYIRQKELLIQLVTDGQQADSTEMCAAIVANGIDYLIVPSGCGLEGYMDTLGCEYVGSSEKCLLYRYCYED